MTDRELPQGWTWTTLGEATIVSPRDAPLDSSAPFVPMSAVEVGVRHPLSYEERGSRAGIRAQGNDVLFARITPCLENGKVALLPASDGPTGGSTEFIVVRPTPAIDPIFLHYWCQHPDVRYDARHQMAGVTGRMRLAGSDLANFALPLPPLPEQRRIVEVLEDHLSRLEAAEASLVAVGNRAEVLDSAQRSRSVAVTPDTDTVPPGWVWHTLGDLSAGSSYGTSTKCEDSAAGTPVVRIPNIKDGRLELTDLKYAVDSDLDLSGLYLGPGDVLFVRTNGSPALIGRTAVVRQPSEMAFASYLIRFELDSVALADWVQLVLSTPAWRQEIMEAAASSAGQYNLNQTFLKSLRVPVPPMQDLKSLLAEHDERVGEIRRLTRGLPVVTSRSAQLRRALLRAAFNGELVDQDPTDEPAEVALERVRERQSTTKPRRRRKAAAAK